MNRQERPTSNTERLASNQPVSAWHLHLRRTVALKVNLDAEMASPVTRRADQMDTQPVMRQNQQIVRVVLTGGFDAGVVRARGVENESLRDSRLVARKAFEAPPDVYVARAGLDPR